jgi:hypothetical protein
MPRGDAIDQANLAIFRAFLANPGLAHDYPIRRPRFAQDVLSAEQVEECLRFVAPHYRHGSCSAISALDVQGESVMVLGSSGSILFVKCSRGEACIDVDQRLVEDEMYLAQQ